MKYNLSVLILLFVFSLYACQASLENPYSEETPLESNPIDMTVAQRVETLTLAEKVGQMLQPERSAISLNEIQQYNIGSVLNAGGSHPNDDPLSSYETWHTMITQMQNAALRSSSGIPLLYGIDAVHGNNNVYQATLFPHNINLGMIQDLSTIERVAEVTALEMAALNMHLNFSPSVAVAHNIRWGRTYESMGQTPTLVTERTQAYLRGVEGIIIPTLKHYVGDGATDDGIDQGNATISEDDLRAIHLIPYIDAITMNVPVIMVSYHSIQGIKMHGHTYYLDEVLKNELGFEGILLSDYNAINQLPGDFKAQLTHAINAGIDMLMQPFNWKEAIGLIIEAVEEGSIPIERIDDAVTRILSVKEAYGLFASPHLPFTPEIMYSESHKDAAYQAAVQSMVLLKDNLQTPLHELGNLYLTGPAADHVGLLAGGWTTAWQGNPQPRIGVGSSIKQALEHRFTLTSYTDADTVIVTLAEVSYAEWFGDTPTPTLTQGMAHPENQAALNRAAQAQRDGKTVLGLLISGRPLVLDEALDYFDLFVAMFLPGPEGGDAIVALLNYEEPFTAKLSFYWPSSVFALDYPSVQAEYQFPIGFGLETLKKDE